jgi:hypothetical protein
LKPKRLVIFVEGKGDVAAIPLLAKRVVKDVGAQDAVFVDPDAFRVRSVATLVKSDCKDFRRWLNAAARTRPDLGGVLIVLDGDCSQVPSTWAKYCSKTGTTSFCTHRVAAVLGEDSRASRAGEQFSLATVFVMLEFEAWLLAGLESLRGKPLAANRGFVPNDAAYPKKDVDIERIRDAAGELRRIVRPYSKTLDQAVLANSVDLQVVRERCRAFRRFSSAIQQIADAVRANRHVVTPTIKANSP